ncbi:MAG: putative entry exclusion protein TrbK-alt [Rhizobiales bacterium]|nr:putative entry exclusion protein TrbK-alt [Hyphomicrobiales bacterium]
MDGNMLVRLGAVVFIGVACTVTVLELTQTPDVPEARVRDDDGARPANPWRAVLRHCRDMGEAAKRDATCLKAWVENRDRFLGQESPASEPRRAAGAAEPTPPFSITPAPTQQPPAEEPAGEEVAPADVGAPAPNGAR